MKTIYAADLFCGAGGSSTALFQTAEQDGFRVELTAVNHWETAVETHSQNHPGARHLCADLDSLNPRKAVPGGKLDLLWASPECTHHSRARGGRPMEDQSRATAWCVLRWAEALAIETILIENVCEFVEWGPLYPSDYAEERLRGRPIPSERGKYFRNFLRNLRCLGYTVEYRTMICANHGDATTRKRFFLMAQKGRRRSLRWPVATHQPPIRDGLALETGLKTWVPARDILDWNLKGKSIFGRKRPLAQNTLRRIFAGLERFGGARFVLGQQSGSVPRSLDDPLPTIAGAGAISLTEPFLVVFRNHCDGRSLDSPLPAVCTSAGHFGVATPFLVGAGGQSGSGKPQSLESPLGTVLADDHRALVTPYLVEYHGGRDAHWRVRSVDDPIPTQDTSNRMALAEPFLVSYYSNGQALSVDAPLATVTGEDRFGLVGPELLDGAVLRLDILFRMLAPHELAAAHSFPECYRFAGTRDDIVRQIGNSVPVRTAAALCRAGLRKEAA